MRAGVAGIAVVVRASAGGAVESKEVYSTVMGTLVKMGNDGRITIPTGLRSSAGLAAGGLMDAVFEQGRIVLTPKQKVRTKVVEVTAGADQLKSRLEAALSEVRKGHVSPAYDSGEALVAAMTASAQSSRRPKRQR